jgi:methionyl-tRNA synthetase
MTASYFDGVVPEPGDGEGPESELMQTAARVAKTMDDQVLAVDLTGSLTTAWDLVKTANRWLVEQAPWNTAKDPERRADLARQLYAALEVLRIAAILTYPVMPAASDRLWASLGIDSPLDGQRLSDAAWGGLEPGTKTQRGENLFQRLE